MSLAKFLSQIIARSHLGPTLTRLHDLLHISPSTSTLPHFDTGITVVRDPFAVPPCDRQRFCPLMFRICLRMGHSEEGFTDYKLREIKTKPAKRQFVLKKDGLNMQRFVQACVQSCVQSCIFFRYSRTGIREHKLCVIQKWLLGAMGEMNATCHVVRMQACVSGGTACRSMQSAERFFRSVKRQCRIPEFS